MSFERGVMNQAQEQLNSTDIALNALDTILEDAILEEEEHIIKSNKIIVHISDLSVSNIQGVALYKLSNASVNNFSDYYTITPYNSSIDDLGEVEAAVLLPTDEILRCQHAHKYESVTVIISFFYNDALFNDPSKGKEISTTIVAGVVIPSLKCQLMNPFILIFKSDLNITSPRCAHWNYGLKNQHKNIRGNWKVDSMPTVKSGKPTYVVCRANHLTHFSVLVATRNFQVQQTPQVHLALNIITSIGCALSLTGLSGIFLIGIFYKSWRKRKRNIIMLNFSAALAAEMILFFVSDLVRDNATACRIVGASLHYTIIASFGWMLIVAILQYRRFVLVYEQTIRCLILKSLIIGWCMPLILVLVCITTFPDSYNKNGDGMCYPDGIYLYYTVAVPILIFVLINLFVIIKILHNVCNIKVERYGADRNEIRLQVSFAILLFFLLGMSWIFGLGVTVSSNTVLSFIFCITATLQGFVVFICFVLMNKESRVFWVNIKKFIICAKMRSQS
ncbi:adhesion G-protein coupled receptor G2-like [Photinus pyralis]|uniref:adhesion G-protein coupled receptor G2-like n=1 Tax=Photinus pyralis TaxID=7054 RepID=UPI0012674234|nr:adhesion G-protein coupled receptor G2-like [Photinus pyralis]